MRDSLHTLFDRFGRLVEKLPGGLQKPILREFRPIREIYLDQRPARLMLLGDSALGPSEFLDQLCAAPVQIGESSKGWRRYEISGRGAVEILDARDGSPKTIVDTALTHQAPDAVLILDGGGSLGEVAAQLAGCPTKIPVLAVPSGDNPDSFLARVSGQDGLASRSLLTKTLPALPEALCAALPRPAKLEFARLTAAREAQSHIAASLLKSFAAICGVIGLQPIPLADLPILTALQTLMVGLIIRTSGRPVTPRLIGEFAGALGVSIGAGMLFREGARAAIKVVPIWGNLVSGFVAGAGTYAIGRAAIAYFIEESPLNEVKKLFRLARQKRPEIEERSKTD